jgi:acetyltransferase-like isoleucine patch superfamily enzyme
MNIIIQFFGIVFALLERSKWQCIYYNYRKKYNLPSSFSFDGYGSCIYGDGVFESGENSYVGQQVWIQTSKNTVVKIGRNCRLAHNIRIYTSSADPDDNLDVNPKLIDSKNPKIGDVVIGNGVWVEANVFY